MNHFVLVAFISFFCYDLDKICQHGTVQLSETDETFCLPLIICTIRGIYKGDA